jgi:thioredoxin reductase (NADPH)
VRSFIRSHNVIIIGAGPAGISAAIQLNRAGFSPQLVERDKPGGLLLNANLVENYPGFPHGVRGEELVRFMVRQLQRSGVRIESSEVTAIARDGEHFLLDSNSGGQRAKSVIVATGTRGIIPDDIPLPSSLIGSRILCEPRDLDPEPGTRVAVIGGGDCAFDYALNLAGKGCKVSIVHKGSRPGALSILVERVAGNPYIDYISGVNLKDLEESERGIVMQLTGRVDKTFEVEFLMLAVGREPENAILSPEIMKDLESGIEVKGLYLVGDVKRGLMRQVGIAVGDGLMAAMDIGRKQKGFG